MKTKKHQMPIGLEIIGDLKKCNQDQLNSMLVDDVSKSVSKLIVQYGFSELGSFYHQFDIGLTGVIALAESHVTFHTWPEYQYVSLNVYACNYTQNNESNALLLFDDLAKLFTPKSIKILKIKRIS